MPDNTLEAVPDRGDLAIGTDHVGVQRLGAGHSLGVAWYLFPDETHNTDGRHTAYLNSPGKWRDLDPDLFDCLRSIISADKRNVEQIGRSRLLGDVRFSSVPLAAEGGHNSRAVMRANWFKNVLSDLSNCAIVCADPDNGLCEDSNYKMASKRFWKRIPLTEALVLAEGRTAIIYYHNTRRAGGHAKEI